MTGRDALVTGRTAATQKIKTGDRLRVNDSTDTLEILVEETKQGDVVGSDLLTP